MNDDTKMEISLIVLLFAIILALVFCPGCSIPGKIDGDDRPPGRTQLGTNQNGHVYVIEPFDWAFNNNKDSGKWK